MRCLAEALELGANFGVWGGLTERERRALLRRYRTVEDWTDWLANSEDELAAEIRQSCQPRVLSMVRA